MKNKSFAAGLKKLFGLYKGPDESFFEDLTDTGCIIHPAASKI